MYSTAKIEQIMLQIAERVEAIYKDYKTRKLEIVVTQKKHRDYVTDIDLKLEASIISIIQSLQPKCKILSEETKSTLPDEELDQELWIIDPIDGTNNFIRGLYDCSLAVAFAKNKIVQDAMVIDFQKNHTYSATLGKGAYLNNHPIRVSATTTLSEAMLGMDLRTDPKEMKANLLDIISIPDEDMPLLRIGGSGVLQMCEVASGKLDCYYHTKLKPWDKAASLLIIKEAGGVAIDLKGNPAHWLNPGLIVGNKSLVNQLARHLKIQQSN